MASSYYIYYRVDPAQAEAARRQIAALIAAVADATQASGRVLRKRGEPHLWMEVYEDVQDEARFERALAEAVAKLKVTEFLLGGSSRHIECFES